MGVIAYLSLKRSEMARVNEGSQHSFFLPPTRSATNGMSNPR